MLTLTQLISECEKNFFDVFNSDFETDYNTLFENLTPDELNIIMLSRHGQKFVMQGITAVNFARFAHAYINVNMNLFMSLKKAAQIVNSGQTETHTKRGTIDRTNTHENNRLNAEKVFNDIEFQDNNKTSENSENLGNETYDLTEVTIKGNSELLLSYVNDSNNYITQIIDYLATTITLLTY